MLFRVNLFHIFIAVQGNYTGREDLCQMLFVESEFLCYNDLGDLHERTDNNKK